MAKRIRSSLPNDIMNDILPQLPVKSLVRFKCVSKSFNDLLSSPEFSALHKTHSRHENHLLILAGSEDRNIYLIDITSPDSASPATNIPLPNTLDGDWSDSVSSIVGTFNGLVCVRLENYIDGIVEYKHMVINPCTAVFKEIPYNPTGIATVYGLRYRVSFGFAFDDINQDYKLVRVLENSFKYCPYSGDDISNRQVMVYSLNHNSWKLTEDVDRPSYSFERNRHGVALNNYLLHWVFWGFDKYRICCFDVRSDKWVNDVPLMDLFTYPQADFYEDEKDKVVHIQNLGVVDGCLCLYTGTNLTGVVWIMKEYGVKESWVKLVEFPHTFDPFSFFFRSHFCFRQGSRYEVLVREGNTRLFWSDIRSKTCDRAKEIKGVPAFGDVHSFKGSLVPVPGGKKIQASLIKGK